MKGLLQEHSSASVRFAKAIADESRQQIMKLCAHERQSVTELVEQLGLAQPTVSHHLAVLKAAGLVEEHPEGRQVFYRLNQAHLARCCGRLLQAFTPEAAARQIAEHREGTLIASGCADPPRSSGEGDV